MAARHSCLSLRRSDLLDLGLISQNTEILLIRKIIRCNEYAKSIADPTQNPNVGFVRYFASVMSIMSDSVG